MQNDTTLSLVGQIYDAVSEPAQWDTFLGNLAKIMSAHATRMRMFDNSSNFYNLIAGTGHNESYDEYYSQYFNKVDVWNPVLNAAPPGMLFNSVEIVPSNEFRSTEIYNDFFRDYDVFYGIGAVIAKSDDVIARIGIHRSQSQGEYGESDFKLLQSLMPHLLRAFKLGSHIASLQAQNESIQQALYHSPTPIILIDETSQVAFVNQRAETILGGETGLLVLNNRLTAILASEQNQLQQLLQQAVAAGARRGTCSGGAMRLTTQAGEQRYSLLITPYPARTVSRLGINRRICAAVFFHDSQLSGRLPANTLKTLYGMTRSEIRLAEGVMSGLTPAEAAAKYRVSVNTTRSQLRSLFAKTGTKRQAELVRLLVGLKLSLK